MAVSAGDLEDDRALVQAVQQGDLDAYSELFRRHYPAVRRACARRLLDSVEADEIAQAAFVRAFERIGQCEGDRRFGPWVHVIARYLCVDSARAKARVVPQEAPLSDDVSSGSQPEDSMLDREQTEHVHRALASLPERQRHAVIARTFEGRRPVEIAATLGLSVAAVDSLLVRARRGLAVAYNRVAGEGGAAATATSTSAAASLGGTIAVGPNRVVDNVVAAGHAIGGAAGDVAVKAAGLSPVRGIGAGIASAVMSVTVAVTGNGGGAPQVNPTAEREAVVVTTTVPFSTLPPLPIEPLPGTDPTPDPMSRQTSPAGVAGKDPTPGTPSDLSGAVPSLPLSGLLPSTSPNDKSKDATPPPIVPGVTGRLTDAVGGAVQGLTGSPSDEPAPEPKDNGSKKKRPPAPPAPLPPVSGITNAVGGLL